jgi:uncharacterized protein
LSKLTPISTTSAGIVIRLRVQPRASRDEVTGVIGDAIRVRLTAPPVDGEANEALVRFLASRLEVPRSAVTLLSGLSSRTKLVAVEGLSAEQVTRRLM